MDKNNLPIIGMVIAAVIAFGPSFPLPGPSPSSVDTLDKADDEYREKIADILVDFKDKDKTKAVSEEFSEEFAAARLKTHKDVNQEIFALWWNGKAEEAALRVRSRKLGIEKEIPQDDD